MEAEKNLEQALNNVGDSAHVTEERLEKLREQFNDPNASMTIYTEPELLEPTAEEVAEIEQMEKSIEVRDNLAWLETEEGTVYKKAVTNLYTREEVKGNEELDGYRDKLFAGAISRDEFESAFSAVFTDILKAKQEAREKVTRFYANMGIKWYEYPDVHKLNNRIHPDMDTTNHYVEIKRDPKTHRVCEAHVHERKCWEDGTPQLYIQDMPEWERALFAHFHDLTEYHEDGRINIEMTVALHEQYYARKEARRIEKYGRYAPLMPSVKIGRNDKCPCGSGKKYKRCHLNEPAVFASTMEQAQKHFGKGAFDYQAPEEPKLEVVLP